MVAVSSPSYRRMVAVLSPPRRRPATVPSQGGLVWEPQWLLLWDAHWELLWDALKRLLNCTSQENTKPTDRLVMFIVLHSSRSMAGYPTYLNETGRAEKRYTGCPFRALSFLAKTDCMVQIGLQDCGGRPTCGAIQRYL